MKSSRNKTATFVLAAWLIFLLPMSAHAQQIFLNIVTARPIVTIDGRSAVGLTLTESSRESFANFTALNLGKFIEVRWKQEILMRARLTSPINGGTMSISGKLDEADSIELAKQLSSGNETIEVRVSDQ